MHARMTILDGSPDRVDAALDQVRSEVLPVIREQRGFRGFTVMADRSTGRMIGMSYWDSAEDVDASEDAVRASRDRAAQASGAREPRVERYEVLMDMEK